MFEDLMLERNLPMRKTKALIFDNEISGTSADQSPVCLHQTITPIYRNGIERRVEV